MDRCIAVLTVGRSGSSAVAGVLDKLGVVMAHKYMGANDANPRGFYEDVPLNRMLHTPLKEEQLYKYFAKRRRDGLWGMKDPALVYKLPRLFRFLGDVRIVVVKRDVEEIVASCKRVWSKANRAEIDRKAQLIENLVRWRTHTTVWYNELIDDTERVVTELRDFVYDGLDRSLPDTADAIEFVDPELYRCRKDQ